MSFIWIIGIVILLYWRTLSYNYIIDDNVKRNGYMYEVPLVQPDPKFFFSRPSKWYRCFMIGMHCVNAGIIYMLWGWCPALLFAVHPQCVWGVAWVTGNYYATTAYFTLIAYFILHAFPNLWGAAVAMPIFAAGLNSTICCVSFPFIYLFIGQPWGLSLFIPLAFYLKGKRFTAGIKTRDSFNAGKPIDAKFTYKRFFLITKTIAKYILDCFYPDRLGLFGPFGNGCRDKQDVYDKFHSPNLHFWASFLICASLFIGGLFISPVGTFWFFTVIALHSQWRLTGQFYAQRYIYLAIIGLCVVVGTAIQPHPVLVAVITTFLVIRTHLFIPAFKNQECLYLSDRDAFPEYAQVYNNVAQFYINAENKKPWRVNEIGALLFRAEEMAPDDWSIKMNVACFFALLGQLEPSLQKTKESLELVRPLGGLKHPVEMLEKQVENLQNLITQAKQKQGVANVSPQPAQIEQKAGT